jgi:cell division protein ZapA
VKQIEVQIMGQGYVLGCPEGGETRLGQAVGKVDEAMCKIRDAGKIKARDRIAVLAALNLAFDLTDRPAASTTSGDNTTSSTDLHNLLQRMDALLARDNQLI